MSLAGLTRGSFHCVRHRITSVIKGIAKERARDCPVKPPTQRRGSGPRATRLRADPPKLPPQRGRRSRVSGATRCTFRVRRLRLESFQVCTRLLVDVRHFAGARPGDVQSTDAVRLDPDSDVRRRCRLEQIDHQQRLALAPRLSDGQRRTALRGTDAEHERTVAVADVPTCALRVVGQRRLAEGIAAGDRSILGAAPFRAPTSSRNAPCERDVEGGTVDAGLAAGHDLFDGPYCVAQSSLGGETGSLAGKVPRSSMSRSSRCASSFAPMSSSQARRARSHTA